MAILRPNEGNSDFPLFDGEGGCFYVLSLTGDMLKLELQPHPLFVSFVYAARQQASHRSASQRAPLPYCRTTRTLAREAFSTGG
ncbi:hypothetical protein D1007_38354 [Hordeum vulgare]|nr:hypothetical protein D1007_38354 [Hordeum vulgare]